ncbi:hypothetical protein BGZ72_004428 [Mortierella alpina]|nr:hypothetical protein BGZ72_004428 [Mortierella alpina]
MADMMEQVLRRVEQEQGTSLLNEESWNLLGDYIATVRGTIVVQKDMSDLLGLLLSTPKVEPAVVEEPVVAVETEQMLLQDALPQHQGRDDNIYLRSEPGHPQPRHPSALPHRPRPPAAIRKITLGESGQPRPRNPRTMRESSAEDTDGSDHRSSPEHGSRGSHSGASSSPSSPSFQGASGMKDWRTNYNQRSIREPSQTEYEGVGLEADYESPENDDHLDSVKQAYWLMQKRLRQKENEYEAGVNAHVKENMLNQQQIEDLRRDLKTMRREISELRGNEQSKSSQIEELEKQIEISERTSSTQKNSAATLKKQRDELAEDNSRMQEWLRQKEEALNQAMIRLTAKEADSRRIHADQEAMQELRDRLAAEINKNEGLSMKLELSEKLRLKSEFEKTGDELSAGLDNISDVVQGRTLESELASMGAKFGAGITLDEDAGEQNDTESGKWSPTHAGTHRLLQESTSLSRKLKRSSIRDLNQRFKETGLESPLSNELKEPSQYTPTALTAENAFAGDDDAAGVVALKHHRADDVDCELPLELQRIEKKEVLMHQELGAQKALIDELFKVQPEATSGIPPFGHTPFGSEMVLGQKSAGLTSLQKVERARRRKAPSSRVLTSAELAVARGGELSAPSMALTRKESKNAITNVTLVSMYTIIVYLFGVITSVFLVDNGHAGAFNYGRVLDAFQDVAVADMNGAPGRFKVLEVLVYWLQNLVWQGDGGFIPT